MAGTYLLGQSIEWRPTDACQSVEGDSLTGAMCFRLDRWQPVLLSAGGVHIGVTHGSRPNIENWVFANPATGKPYWPGRVQENWLIPAAKKLGIGRIGWHTFRHSHPTLHT